MIEIPGIKENPLPKELMQFLNEVQENPAIYAETVVFNRIKDYIVDLSPKQVAWLTSTIILTTEFRLRVFKKRCDAGDKLACEMLDLTIDGDPYSKNITVKKGIMGLWRVDNDVEAGKLLVELDRITQEEFDNIIRTGRDKEIIVNGKTRDKKLEELAVEAKTYPTADAFSMAMIMGRLKSVPTPNTKNVYEIIRGKYGSAEEFWNAVNTGEISVPEKEAVPVEPAVEGRALTGKELYIEQTKQAIHDNFLRSIGALINHVSALVRNNQDSDARQQADTIRGQITDAVKTNIITEEEADTLREQLNEILKKIAIEVKKESPPQPPKEKERNARLDLMKREIEERIAKKKREKESGGKKVKESPDDIPPDLIDESGIKEDISNLSLEEIERRSAALKKRLKQVEDVEGPRDISIYPGDEGIAEKTSDLPKEERVEIAKQIAQGAAGPRDIVPGETPRRCPGKPGRTYCFNCKLYTVTSPAQCPYNDELRDIREGGIAEEPEPQDYTQYTYGDFEVLIKGLDNVEDFEDMLDYIDMSKVLTDDERKGLRSLIERGMNEIGEE